MECLTIWVLRGFRILERILANFSSEILNEPKESHFCEAKKGVTFRVCVTIRGLTILTLYSQSKSTRMDQFT